MPGLTLENTAIVLDSTGDPPKGYVDTPGIFVVPLTVHFGDESYRDGVDLDHGQFFAKLQASSVLPTTSQPTVADFLAVYREVRATYDHVFSLHLSSKMSGTYGAASRAAEAVDGVDVYDTKTVTAPITLLAERLRARLAQGCSLAEARDYIAYFIANEKLLIHAATLEYLRRGGRIGRAASLVGDVFDIKPLITNVDGELAGYAKVRGLKKAFAAMERFLDENSRPDDTIYFAVIEALNDTEPAQIRELIEQARPNAEFVFATQVGAVVGTHIGPGAAAFTMIVE